MRLAHRRVDAHRRQVKLLRPGEVAAHARQDRARRWTVKLTGEPSNGGVEVRLRFRVSLELSQDLAEAKPALDIFRNHREDGGELARGALEVPERVAGVAALAMERRVRGGHGWRRFRLNLEHAPVVPHLVARPRERVRAGRPGMGLELLLGARASGLAAPLADREEAQSSPGAMSAGSVR